ncbi:Cupredoxin [Hymenopellis radicata]|nr:Cupredoxin [Hymenopellis radicata]
METNLHPLENPGAPGLPQAGGADVVLNLALDFDFNTFLFTVNGAPFIPPTAPCLCVAPNKVIEIVIPGLAIGGPHPFHLHGVHTFDVVRSAGNTSYNYDNPVGLQAPFIIYTSRMPTIGPPDVVSTGLPGDEVTIRFVTNNAGPWFLHCHINWHLEIGLAVVLAEDVVTIAASNPPTAWDKLCPIYDALDPSQL